MAQVEEEKKPSRFRRWYNRLAGKEESRKQTAWNRLHLEGGFIPLQNMGDVEARRTTLEEATKSMQEDFATLYQVKVKGKCRYCGTEDGEEQLIIPSPVGLCESCATREYKRRCNMKVFNLFMSVGSPWYRGLDDRELAKKVRAYLELWNYIGELEAFTDDLFMCSMQLIHLSWKSLDVTATPFYVIESHTKYVVNPEDTRLSKLPSPEEQ